LGAKHLYLNDLENKMAISEFTNEQRRELINMQQLFDAWRASGA